MVTRRLTSGLIQENQVTPQGLQDKIVMTIIAAVNMTTHGRQPREVVMEIIVRDGLEEVTQVQKIQVAESEKLKKAILGRNTNSPLIFKRS